MSTTKKLNKGIVKLTKENINEGRLGNKIKSISGSDKVLTKNELIKERRKIIPDDGIGEDIYFFGYGPPFVVIDYRSTRYQRLKNNNYNIVTLDFLISSFLSSSTMSSKVLQKLYRHEHLLNTGLDKKKLAQ